MGQAVGASTVTAATVYIAPNTPSASAVELHVLVLGGIALGPGSRRESGSLDSKAAAVARRCRA